MAHPTLSPQAILNLYRDHGDVAYTGEPVSHLAHGWQCARLAAVAKATATLQLACWLHDLGHLASGLDGTPTLRGHDDRHEELGADLLAALWGPAVAEPVRLHVQAKRYLVSRQPTYAARLSPDSRRSLVLQGGALTREERVLFESSPYHPQALQLRAWDEQAKQPGWFAASRLEALTQLQALMENVDRLRSPG